MDVFSCDVFDTFLLRRCTSPDGVFERTFELAGIASSHPNLRAAFVQHRQLAEGRARAAAAEHSNSGEVFIEDIYRRFPCSIFGLSRTDWPRLISAEFQAETELCFVNPSVLETFQGMRRAGIRCGFMSDTYWNAERLATLLRHAVPGLDWDFLYPSCDHGTSKSNGLFARMLHDLKAPPDRVSHLGDNEWADVRAARRHAIQAIHLPQAAPALAGIFERESTVFSLLYGQGGQPHRLDHGTRSVRRLVAGSAPRISPAFSYGVQMLGPIFSAFHAFIADRVRHLRRQGGTVAVVFLARDAMLSWRLWQQQTGETAPYVEINRRVAVLAASTAAKDLGEIFLKVPQMNLGGAKGFFKTETAAMGAFFAAGPASGKAFAAALPDLLGEDTLTALFTGMRRDMLAHLRDSIPGFDQCGDVVLVDLGYGGTVQRKLRKVFDAEGLPQRLHGLYLLTEDEAFLEIPESDSAEGFLSDRVLTPHAKRAILNNIAIIEQLCAAQQGSVMGYDGGQVLREPDTRPQEQRDLCAQAQDGALYFARAATTLPACFAHPDQSAPWAAAMLARAVLLPTDDELVLLGGVRHDVNMGVQTLVPLLDAPLAQAMVLAKALPSACTAHQPPMWPAAGMAALSPLHGLHYALFAAGALPADMAGDVACGTIELAVGDKPLAVTTLRTGDGDLRLRIPVLARGDARAMILPAESLPARGVIRGAALQQGGTAAEAMASKEIAVLPLRSMTGTGITLADGVYTVTQDDGYLAVPLPALHQTVGVITLTIAPLTGARVLALSD